MKSMAHGLSWALKGNFDGPVMPFASWHAASSCCGVAFNLNTVSAMFMSYIFSRRLAKVQLCCLWCALLTCVLK